MAWKTGLDSATADRLERLNPDRYLAHKTQRIAGHVALAEQLPRRWQAVELGSNRGAFCIGLAERHPEWAILALEWRHKWAARSSARAASLELRNLHIHRADARIALPILAPEGSIERLFVLYPDPWWKTSHDHRRLLERTFFEVAADLLAPGGLLCIKTDVRLVRDELAEMTASVSGLRALPPHEWPDERGWPLTTRERNCLRDAIATYRLFWIRA